MVLTRRSSAKADTATNNPRQSNMTPCADTTIHRLPSNSVVDPPVTPRMANAALNAAPTGNINEHDLSSTCPSTEKTPEVITVSTPKTQDSTDLHQRTVSSALRRLAPQPFGNMSGSSRNPIIVNETSSPPRPTARTPKRKHRRNGRLPEPHKFLNKGYRDLYNYRISGPALAATPANGSTFTGHRGDDLHRMMNAKLTAAPNWNPHAAWGRNTRTVPFEVQYSISAHHSAQKQQQSMLIQPSPHAQYYQYQAPPIPYPMLPSQNEDMLRKKAAQCIRESARPSPRKRKLSDVDPEETNTDDAESEKPEDVVQSSASKKATRLNTNSLRSPQTTVSPHENDKLITYGDPNLDINRLIEHSSLITSLLHTYPHSTDQTSLRQVISMIVALQNQHITAWINADTQNPRKRSKSNSDSAICVDGDVHASTAVKVQKERDTALRKVFSADADLWQDGTGHGVVDVFVATAALSPARRLDVDVLTRKDRASRLEGTDDEGLVRSETEPCECRGGTKQRSGAPCGITEHNPPSPSLLCR
ncbi:hypothetical protein BDW02DRAFT_139525 [Decorospora gaudefroyi]|uniref:Uncharacterized protein n=1 Tax=Decorospora gaudefroyi TaxID=184978 RepID=A0A6A5KMN7_9PLEO|nr:hypothetical protein BDW02DRAFT_139525 [Decorospora gaudefroyi]